MKNIILVVLIALFTFSCLNEQKKESKPIEVEKVKEKEIKKEFIVKINFKTNKEDSFKLMLNNIVVDEFQSKNILITERVAPSSNFESITANFGENISKGFRVNLGNKEVKEVEISSIEISYGENKLSINANELNSYFTFDRFVNYDTISNKFKTKRVDGKHTPTITLKTRKINLLNKD